MNASKLSDGLPEQLNQSKAGLCDNTAATQRTGCQWAATDTISFFYKDHISATSQVQNLFRNTCDELGYVLKYIVGWQPQGNCGA